MARRLNEYARAPLEETFMTTRLSTNEVRALYEKICNWGRWGADDERGALNFITPQKRAAAARLAQSGEIISLSLPLSTKSAPDNPQPVQHMMLHAGAPGYASLDYFAIAPHGMAFTHLDALCHVFWEGKMYNGFSDHEVGRFGARRCAIDVTRDGVMSRGVLLDIPRAKQVDWLELREAIYPEDLEAAESLGQLRLGEGDVLLLRTGRHKRRAVKGAWDPRREGSGARCLLSAMAARTPDCRAWMRCCQRHRPKPVWRRDGPADSRRYAGHPRHSPDR
jgi:kynurenine formamidase